METPEAIYSWLELRGNFLARPQCQIDSRGWTFQERLLSKRVLTVTEKGLFWDCCTLSTTDRRLTRLKGDNSPEFRDSNERRIKRQLLANDTLSTGNARSEMFLVWRRIIEDYSQRAFSRPIDRVIALQGVVDRMESFLGERYFLGVWKGDAIRSLIWFCEKPDLHSIMPESSREDIVEAPSWSWTSVSIPIHHKLWHPIEGFIIKSKEVISPCARLVSMGARLSDATRFSAYTGEVVFYGSLVQLPMSLISGPGYQTFTDKALHAGQRAETFSHGGVGTSSIPLSTFLRQHAWSTDFFAPAQPLEDLQARAPEQHRGQHRQSELPKSSEESFILPIFREHYSTTNQAIYCLHLSPQLSEQYFQGFDPNNPTQNVFVRKGVTIIDESNCLNTFLQQIYSSQRRIVRIV
ncbi:het domain protein [Colletotrichum kahawae]|uniref:Het domain protein n=1 Tax=Colletotrichum kahawae TaxID=34407 RepID=A0AAD9YHV6_COLKA|nr:het domain protein [Colletotrichum kahawae]